MQTNHTENRAQNEYGAASNGNDAPGEPWYKAIAVEAKGDETLTKAGWVVSPEQLLATSAASIKNQLATDHESVGIDLTSLSVAELLFTLPDEAFVRLPSIIGTTDAPGPLPISTFNFWARVADGRLPKPHKLGAGSRVSVWKIGEIRAALARFKQED